MVLHSGIETAFNLVHHLMYDMDRYGHQAMAVERAAAREFDSTSLGCTPAGMGSIVR